MNHFSIAKDFSRFPAGRTKGDGPFNGERLRAILLEKLKEGPLTIDLNGTLGFGSSFLEAAFSDLGNAIAQQLSFVSDDDSLPYEIQRYMQTKEELLNDRDALLEALGPYAIQIACPVEGHSFDPVQGSSASCGKCHVCETRAFYAPLVKWVRKGFRSKKVSR